MLPNLGTQLQGCVIFAQPNGCERRVGCDQTLSGPREDDEGWAQELEELRHYVEGA
jgi:hypothetical protein